MWLFEITQQASEDPGVERVSTTSVLPILSHHHQRRVQTTHQASRRTKSKVIIGFLPHTHHTLHHKQMARWSPSQISFGNELPRKLH